MKRFLCIIFSVLICSVLFTRCELQDMNVDVSQDEITDVLQDENAEDADDENTYASQDGNSEDPEDENAEKLQGIITYPKYGKIGPNILDDDFIEATRTDDKLVGYSLTAVVPAGAGLKIVIITNTKENKDEFPWGGFYAGSADNWLFSNYDPATKSNTFTVYESGKRADVTVTLMEDCIIEFYENGSETPTKVKEIKVSPDVITGEKPQPDTDGLQGVITYPKYGKIGLNILDDGFVGATKTGDKLVEYSLTAEVPVGAGLKIVIKTDKMEDYRVWGGFYAGSADNWLYTNYDPATKSNTFTVYESGKRADLTVTFFEDCIIEYYENGDKTPTKVKEIKVSPDIVTDEKPQPDTDGLQGVITYPKNGKMGPNILAGGFVQATPTGEKLAEYSLNAEVPVGAGLKIVIRTNKAAKEDYRIWGGFYADYNENWLYTNYDPATGSNTFTVYESGKRADLTVTFFEDCIIEYYENGAKTPTKVKEIKMIR